MTLISSILWGYNSNILKHLPYMILSKSWVWVNIFHWNRHDTIWLIWFWTFILFWKNIFWRTCFRYVLQSSTVAMVTIIWSTFNLSLCWCSEARWRSANMTRSISNVDFCTLRIKWMSYFVQFWYFIYFSHFCPCSCHVPPQFLINVLWNALCTCKYVYLCFF